MRATVLALLLACQAGQAFAHAILVDSFPAPTAHVPAGHLDVTLRYNSRIDAVRSKLTLVRPDGGTDRLPPTATDKPDILRMALDLAPGDYTIKWQVLATDGHITRGNVPFTVDKAAPARPGAR